LACLGLGGQEKRGIVMPSGVYKRTAEHRINISEAKKGEKNPWWRKTHTEETRKIMSESHKGILHTEEAKKKVSEAKKGKKRTEETKRKISESAMGRIAWNKGIIGENHHSWKGGKKLAEKKAYNKRKNKLEYQLNNRMRGGIWESLKGNKNGRHWEDLVSYNLVQLKKHLKSTMPDDYSWNDFLSGDLHIDHIIPISEFNFTKPEDLQFQQCWALDNLRLLPAKENLKKGSKLIKPFQMSIAV